MRKRVAHSALKSASFLGLRAVSSRLESLGAPFLFVSDNNSTTNSGIVQSYALRSNNNHV